MQSEISQQSPSWSLGTRIVFRFFCVYWLLYLVPYPLSTIPGLGWTGDWIRAFWVAIVPWFGNDVLGIDYTISIAFTGSGDTTFAYVLLLLQVIIAIATTVIWSIIDQSRPRYTRLDDTLRILVRYALGTVLITYGVVKVIKVQFPYPSDARLLEPYGESSPMGLLWTFMGYSTPYTMFTGAAELVGGLLVLFRRTTVLGACILVGVLTNVVMLNFSYDVPVKLYSLHLLIMALYLLAPHSQRLLSFFVLNRPVASESERVPYCNWWLERVRPIAKALFICWFMYHHVSDALERQASMEAYASDVEFAGLYRVETVVEDDVVRPPVVADGSRWYLIGISTYKNSGLFYVRHVDGSMERYTFIFDPETATLSLTERLPGKRTLKLTYTFVTSDFVRLTGTMDDAPFALDMQRTERSYLLSERGLNWINEYPFNR